MTAESFHAETQQWAGPHSRTSRNRIRASTATFLSRRIGSEIKPHPTMLAGEPFRYAVIEPIPCPDDLIQKFTTSEDAPYQLKRTFIRSQSESNSRIGTTWFSKTACFSSVNRSSFWTQRKPLIAYWKTKQDPAGRLSSPFSARPARFCFDGLTNSPTRPSLRFRISLDARSR